MVSETFSIGAALGGTVTSHRRRTRGAAKVPTASWFFEVHEDTVEETITNFTKHSTYVLDINSDNKSRDKADRGKENIPPADDVSQTSSGAPRTHAPDGERS